MNRIIATRDNTFTRYWYLTVDPDCTDKIDRVKVAQLVAEILNDARGWRKHGYVFKQITPLMGSMMRNDRSSWKSVFHIRVAADSTILHECGFGGLSCADMSMNVIYINIDRWLHGAKASGLDLIPYRYYLVQHEIGHLLGRDHATCKCNDGECQERPIMVQATIAKDSCRPNMWPLRDE